MGRNRAISVVAALLVLVGASGGTTASRATSGGGGYSSEVYSRPESWICHADAADFCDADHDATRVDADGTLAHEPWRAARRAPVDCFYLYPTVSHDAGQYSDMQWTMDEEGGTTWAQVGRLGEQCRVFAPMYRSVTLTWLFSRLTPPIDPSRLDPEPYLDTPYADVLDAWRHYLANHNEGRGVILLGHSQGSMLVSRLLREEVDRDPAQRDLLVSAYVIGHDVQVPVGRSVGGDLQNIPLCRRAWQTGCVVTYGSYRSTARPEPNAAIGGDDGGGLEAGCTNPAALAGGRRYLRPYLWSGLPESQDPITRRPSGPWVDPAYGTVTTPWVTLPRLVEGECRAHNGHHYLEITTHGDPADPRVDDLGGDITFPGVPPGMAGLHNYDYGYTLGDIQRLARIQSLVHLMGL